ncbi:MAG: hypothetical protein ACK5O1_04620 [Holosporales bacterium]
MTESSDQPLESEFLKMVRAALAIQQIMPSEGFPSLINKMLDRYPGEESTAELLTAIEKNYPTLHEAILLHRNGTREG